MKFKCCRFCLAVKVRVFKLEESAEKTFIENVCIQNNLDLGTIIKSSYICFECKALLNKSYNFLQRMLLSHKVLQDIYNKNKVIKLADIKRIDREEIGVSSNLVTHTLRSFDVYGGNDNNDGDQEYNPSCSEEYKRSNKKVLKKEHTVKIKEENTDQNGKDKVKKALQPSSFILSLASIGDRRKRRQTKSYVLEEKVEEDDVSIKYKGREIEEDTDFKLSSTDDDESIDSNYDMYDDLGKRVAKPKREYPRPCEVDNCECELESATKHHHHYMTFHPNVPYPFPNNKIRQSYVCHYCGFICKRKHFYRGHLATHSGEKKHRCKECHKRYFSSYHLTQHMRRSHPKTLLECDYCAKKFKARSDIIRHFRIHTGEKPYNCYICGAGFAHKGNVGIHIQAKHEQLDKIKKKSKARKLRASKKTKPKQRKRMKSSSDDDDLNLMQLKVNQDNEKVQVSSKSTIT